jgi:hypothetical protein
MSDSEFTDAELNDIAEEAARRLAEEAGTEELFPFDRLYRYIDVDVPKPRFQHKWRHLKEEGYLRRTNQNVNAETGSRKGSPTTAYKLGPHFRDEVSTEESQGEIADCIAAMTSKMEAQGFVFSGEEVANFYLSILSSPLVILAGLSGTGKSHLPRLFADIADIDFQAISVQPQWADDTDLFGYTPTLKPNTFVKKPLTEIVEQVCDSEEPMIALLDEMNLAVVEHYFSSFVSVVESRRHEDGEIVTDDLPLDLPPPPEDEVDGFEDLRDLQLPYQLRVVGTANMDETTQRFSPKVLDRAIVIEFSNPDLASFALGGETEDFDYSPLRDRLTEPPLVEIRQVYRDNKGFFDAIAVLLEDLREHLETGGISFAYRARDQILTYLWYWRVHSLEQHLSISTAFDRCLLQCILPKISGAGSRIEEMLDNVQRWLESRKERGVYADPGAGAFPFPNGPFLLSAQKVADMKDALSGGATSFWRA